MRGKHDLLKVNRDKRKLAHVHMCLHIYTYMSKECTQIETAVWFEIKKLPPPETNKKDLRSRSNFREAMEPESESSVQFVPQPPYTFSMRDSQLTQLPFFIPFKSDF